ncbi:hypothetical protein FH972_021480 [Carpinus fangiana]|uniref:Protoheme IX farnesyltransferase, mitochondrial n=1 Tax=Carpinus fangiana TaxID=176857 RepID=A0A5N6KPT5_9ROSI|nr:hypothetical protein FH972_021480 [Carpinus fangiana]
MLDCNNSPLPAIFPRVNPGAMMLIHSADIPLVRSLEYAQVCRPCLQRLSRKAGRNLRFASTSAIYTKMSGALGSPSKKAYFKSNDLWTGTNFSLSPLQKHQRSAFEAQRGENQSSIAHTALTSRPTAAAPLHETSLPHRRRKRRQQDHGTDTPNSIPADASSKLSNMSSAAPHNSFKQRFLTYLALTKPRLTFLIVLTTTSAYTLFPVAVSPMSASLTLSPLTLLNLTTGTALSSACANALNMLMEPEHDAKMTRTRNRPLVRRLITPRAAAAFAILTGACGVALLHYGVNPTVAFLGALNVLLYAGCYTPLKRISVVNTWVGAVVGGIPPLMGWAAAAGQATPYEDAGWRDLLFDPYTSAGGWLIAGLLFAWQFPHFNALSYTIRHEYAAAGYRMLASINPRKNAAIALRYSILMLPICVALSYVGVTSWTYAPISVGVNAWVVREAWRFWRHEGGQGTARSLFWASVWQLPLILIMAMVLKQGMWERVFWGGLDEEEWEDALRDLPGDVSANRQKRGDEAKGSGRMVGETQVSA